MGKVTAVAKVRDKTTNNLGDTVAIHMDAAYDDPANKAWAPFTPALSVVINVIPEVAESFELNENYLLTFEKRI